MELIDRAALGIGKANPDVFDKPEYARGWNNAVEIIQNAPTIDAENVVHCKDCRFMKLLGPGYRFCLVWRGVNSLGDEGFCNYGEWSDDYAAD